MRLGVDLGGTKIEAVVLRVGADEPEILARIRVPTGRERGYEPIVATTAQLIGDVARAAGLATLPPIGVGMPGSVTFRKSDGSRSEVPLVKNSNTTCLNGRPFRLDLASAVHALGVPFADGREDAPVADGREGAAFADGREGAAFADGRQGIAFANDANCFALAEAQYGAARGARVAFGMILGTGVGGGLVLRHGESARAWDGLHGIAGEWGHVVLDPRAPLPCYCGRQGCIERFLCGPAIEAAYAARAGTAPPARGDRATKRHRRRRASHARRGGRRLRESRRDRDRHRRSRRDRPRRRRLEPRPPLRRGTRRRGPFDLQRRASHAHRQERSRRQRRSARRGLAHTLLNPRASRAGETQRTQRAEEDAEVLGEKESREDERVGQCVRAGRSTQSPSSAPPPISASSAFLRLPARRFSFVEARERGSATARCRRGSGTCALSRRRGPRRAP